MLHQISDYLRVKTRSKEDSLIISVNGSKYSLNYPKGVWFGLDKEIQNLLMDHLAYTSTCLLPLLYGKKGVIYDGRQPFFEPRIFKNIMYDLPSSADLDGQNTLNYVRDFFNLDFVFEGGEPIIWSRGLNTENRAIISFTGGKESLLTLAVCLELGIEPVLLTVIEPSNVHEHKHRVKIIEEIHRDYGVDYHFVKGDLGAFRDFSLMGLPNTVLGWGNQLVSYLWMYIPFLIHSNARYLFYGNELSCDNEEINGEGWRANFCYDQSSYWTLQMDAIVRQLTESSARVGSLVGPLNEFAVVKALHDGYPDLARHQMSCFCETPETEYTRWCCSCSKCARVYAFLKGSGHDPARVGFQQDMFTEKHKHLFSVFGEGETFGYDRSGLGRGEQGLALYLAARNDPSNSFLNNMLEMKALKTLGKDALESDIQKYLGVHEYPAIPRELKEMVYSIYHRILPESMRTEAKETLAQD